MLRTASALKRIEVRWAPQNATEEVYQKLHEISVRENVSFNALVLQCCRYALDNMEQ